LAARLDPIFDPPSAAAGETISAAVEPEGEDNVEAHPVEERPVPATPSRPIRGLLEARRDLLKFLMRRAQKYGPLVRFGRSHVYLATSPQYVKHVLQDNHLNYVKGPRFRRVMGPLIGEGLIAVDGDDWRRQRRRTQPYFLRAEQPVYMEAVTPIVAELCDRFSAIARANEPVNLNAEMDRLAVAANVRMMCGADAAGDVDSLVAAFVETGHTLNPTAGFSPVRLPSFIPTPTRLRFRRAIKTVDRIIYRLVDDRRRHPDRPKDLLSGLIFNREGESGGDQRLRDEIMTMLHAGFETVSDQLVWNFYTLANHPAIEQTVRDEADAVLSGRIPALADLRNLPELHMVQQEIMRIYPVAWGYFRTALADDRIDGYRIPANALVIISPYVTHRLPTVWDNPEEFKPERFRPEEVARRHRFAFFPFGAGPRHCIGGDVAMLLIAMTIATVLQRFRLEVLPGQHIRPVPRISLKPEPAVWVRIRCRS